MAIPNIGSVDHGAYGQTLGQKNNVAMEHPLWYGRWKNGHFPWNHVSLPREETPCSCAAQYFCHFLVGVKMCRVYRFTYVIYIYIWKCIYRFTYIYIFIYMLIQTGVITRYRVALIFPTASSLETWFWINKLLISRWKNSSKRRISRLSWVEVLGQHPNEHKTHSILKLFELMTDPGITKPPCR